MNNLVLKCRLVGHNNFGILNNLADENHLYRNGKITVEQLMAAAEKTKMQWFATAGHMFEELLISLHADEPSMIPIKHVPCGERSKKVVYKSKVGRPKK